MRFNPLKKRLLGGASAYGLFAFEFFTPGLAQIAKEAGAEANERCFLMLQVETEVGWRTSRRSRRFRTWTASA